MKLTKGPQEFEVRGDWLACQILRLTRKLSIQPFDSIGRCFFLGLMLASLLGANRFATAIPMQVAYVANSDDDTVSIISLASQLVMDTIPVGIHPNRIAFSPNGQRAYVTNRDSNNVSVIDTALGSVVDTVGVGSMPGKLAVSPDGGRVYVTNTASATISVIDTTTNAIEDTISTPAEPSSIAYHPVRDEIWIGYNPPDSFGVTLEVRSTDDHDILASKSSRFDFPSEFNRSWASTDFVFRDDGSEAFGVAGCGFCGRFHRILGVHAGGLIEIVEPDILFDNTGAATAATINPDNGIAYLAKLGQQVLGDRIVEFGGQGRTLNLAERPAGMAISSDGDKLYVLQSIANGFVSVVDTTNFIVVGTISVGALPEGIAISVIGATADFDTESDQALRTCVYCGPV